MTDGIRGLTHPVVREQWFGFSVADRFFRLVDGDRYIAVLEDPKSDQVLDAIPFRGDAEDPRRDIRRLATDWAQRRGLRRAG